MSKNLNGSFFTTKSLNGDNDIEINKLIAERAIIDDVSCNNLEIGNINVDDKFFIIDNSINLLEQSIDDLSSNLDISCANLDVSLNANINNLTATGIKDFTTGNLQLGATTLNSNILGNNHNIVGLNNITSSQGTIDTLTNTNFNSIDISCRHLHIENEFSNSRYITFEDDFSRDIGSFTGRFISGINTDAIDLSMVSYSGSGVKEILLSTDPDTNSYIDVANFGIGTKTPSEKLEVSGTIKGTDLTVTNDITCDNDLTVTNDITCNNDVTVTNDITCNNDLSVDGDGNFKSIIVTDTGTTGGSIELTGQLTINTPTFYAGTSLLKCNGTSYFNGNVGIGIDSASNPLHISTSGQDFIFNDKQFFLQNDPNITTGTLERRRIVADSTGGNILFKLISNLGTGNTTNIDVFDGNLERTSANGFRPENQDYKGQRWVCRHPDIAENDATEQAYQLRAFGSASSQTGLFEYYYDGDAEFSGTLTQGSDKRLKENIIDANTTNLVSDFQKLRFVNFNMIADKTKLKKLGVIAQDLQKIYPSAVKERKIRDDDDNEIDTRLSVKYEVLYLKSCMLVQHLLTENETLKSRLDDLEERIRALEDI